MAEYKKKSPKKRNIKHSTRPVTRKPVKDRNDDIVMRPMTKKPHTEHPKKHTNKKSEGDGLRVLMGTKLLKQKKRLIVASVFVVILLSLVIFSASTPTGPFEFLQNKILSLGNGSYPATISGSELLNAFSADSLTYILTDTHAEIYNKSGKQLFSRQHEFNSPSISVSSQRALIYDRGGKQLYVYNHTDVVHEITLENEIYCAAIGRNGTFAVATKSVGYTSQVTVFNKNAKTKFIWYSSDELVNGIAVSNNGRRIAVSTINVGGGQFKSKVYVFKFSSAEPIFSLEYDDVIYSLNTVSSSRFVVVTDASVDFVKWSKGERLQVENKYSLNVFRQRMGGISAVVTGNNSSNNISVLNKKGKQLVSFDFDGAVSDISVYNKTIFVLSDCYLFAFDFEGKQLSPMKNLSSYDRIFAIDKKNVVAAGNFGLNKISIE